MCRATFSRACMFAIAVFASCAYASWETTTLKWYDQPFHDTDRFSDAVLYNDSVWLIPCRGSSALHVVRIYLDRALSWDHYDFKDEGPTLLSEECAFSQGIVAEDLGLWSLYMIPDGASCVAKLRLSDGNPKNGSDSEGERLAKSLCPSPPPNVLLSETSSDRSHFIFSVQGQYSEPAGLSSAVYVNRTKMILMFRTMQVSRFDTMSETYSYEMNDLIIQPVCSVADALTSVAWISTNESKVAVLEDLADTVNVSTVSVTQKCDGLVAAHSSMWCIYVAEQERVRFVEFNRTAPFAVVNNHSLFSWSSSNRSIAITNVVPSDQQIRKIFFVSVLLMTNSDPSTEAHSVLKVNCSSANLSVTELKVPESMMNTTVADPKYRYVSAFVTSGAERFCLVSSFPFAGPALTCYNFSATKILPLPPRMYHSTTVFSTQHSDSYYSTSPTYNDLDSETLSSSLTVVVSQAAASSISVVAAVLSSGDVSSAQSQAMLAIIDCKSSRKPSGTPSGMFQQLKNSLPAVSRLVVSPFLTAGPLVLAAANMAIVVGVGSCHALAVYVYVRISSAESTLTFAAASATFLRFPAASLTLSKFLLPGSVFGALASLASRGGNDVDTLISALVFIFCAASVVVQFVLLSRFVLPVATWEIYKKLPPSSPCASSGLAKRLLPSGRWAPKELRNRFGPLIDHVRRRYVRLSLTDIVLSLMISVASGAGAASPSHIVVCEVMVYLSAVVSFAAGVATILVRPYRRPLDKWCVPLLHFLLAIICLLKGISNDEQDDDSVRTVIAILQLVQSVVMTMKIAGGFWVSYQESLWDADGEESPTKPSMWRSAISVIGSVMWFGGGGMSKSSESFSAAYIKAAESLTEEDLEDIAAAESHCASMDCSSMEKATNQNNGFGLQPEAFDETELSKQLLCEDRDSDHAACIDEEDVEDLSNLKELSKTSRATAHTSLLLQNTVVPTPISYLEFLPGGGKTAEIEL